MNRAEFLKQYGDRIALFPQMPGLYEIRIFGHGYMSPEEILEHPDNARRHSEFQLKVVEDSLEENGWFDEVKIDINTGLLVNGHGRLKVCREQGENRMPVTFLDMTAPQLNAALLLFDKSSELALWEPEAVEKLMRGVSSGSEAIMELFAQMAEELEIVPPFSELPGEPEEEENGTVEVDEEQTRVKPGDIWKLGNHTLACLDSTGPGNIERVLGDAVPDMIFSDPPYGISIVRKHTNSIGSGGALHFKKNGSVGQGKIVPTNKYAQVIGDDSDTTARAAFDLLFGLFPRAVHIWWGANHYSGFLPSSSCWIVWDKDNGTTDFADAELAWTNQKTAVRIFKHRWNGLLKDSEHNQKRVHPTQKPIALADWCYGRYLQGDIILDPFCGSGPTILAAEQLGKTVYAFELSPDYVDTIMRRWEKETGLEPELIHREEQEAA